MGSAPGAAGDGRYMLTYGTQAGPACTNSNPPPRAHTHPTSPSAPLLWHGQARTCVCFKAPRSDLYPGPRCVQLYPPCTPLRN